METFDSQEQSSLGSDNLILPDRQLLLAMPSEKDSMHETVKVIHFHLESMSSVIERMAANSESSKTWCISLVSAIIVVASEQKAPRLIWLAFLPAFMFLVLDIYYLSLERGFRCSYANFVKKLHDNTWKLDDLYLFDPGDVGSQVINAFSSFSIWPFYGLLSTGIVLSSFFLAPR